MGIQCYAALAERTPLEPFQYEPTDLRPNDVEVSISHCGICHSDLHLINNDWKVSSYPLVPGHEIIGIVEAVGSSVHSLVRGQRVGIGWQSGACFECGSCIAGDEHHCAKGEATCLGRYGGFAERVRVDARFAFPIPDGMDEATAAPLLCGGITVFTPLCEGGVNVASRVGIIGVGGLGHLALQFARAAGADVTAFSSSPDKEGEAREFGAAEFVSLADRRRMRMLSQSFDAVLSTAPASFDWAAILSLLKPRGTLWVVGVGAEPIPVPASVLITGPVGIRGSKIGNRKTIGEMLAVAARHKIGAKIELFPMSEVNRALKKLADNKLRYRAVLEMSH